MSEIRRNTNCLFYERRRIQTGLPPYFNNQLHPIAPGAHNVPAPESLCQLTVVIPARNEGHEIAGSLEALAAQAAHDIFDVVVLANNCNDETAERARSVARAHTSMRLYVLEASLAADVAHVGVARKLAMDIAAQRFLAIGRPSGIIATTDADTVVASDWVAQTIAEMVSVDAIAGYVTVKTADQDAMSAPARSLYVQEMAFRQVWTEVESLIDPRPEDPSPRHGAFVGASFAVTASMYLRAGALPPVAVLEDREFLLALRRVDARVRHSLSVRAYTSGRHFGRAEGGFNAFLRHLHKQALKGDVFLVEDPQIIIAELEVRAAARRIWLGQATADLVSHLSSIIALPQDRCMALINRSAPFGTVYERIMHAWTDRPTYTMVPVADAIVALREEVASRKALTSPETVWHPVQVDAGDARTDGAR